MRCTTGSPIRYLGARTRLTYARQPNQCAPGAPTSVRHRAWHWQRARRPTTGEYVGRLPGHAGEAVSSRSCGRTSVEQRYRTPPEAGRERRWIPSIRVVLETVHTPRRTEKV